jgi:hypothetical protein
MALPHNSDPRFISRQASSLLDVDQLHSLRPQPFGACWVHARVCPLLPLHAGVGDDFDYAYSELLVGQREDACLRRARFHWELCGASPVHPVSVLFRPTGAVAHHPSPRHVAQATRAARAGFALGAASAAAPPGWKPALVFVGESAYPGPGRPAAHAWMGQCLQDLFVMKLLGFPRGGFFVDLAAYDAVALSNTAALELYYDWDGICVEPMERHLWGLRCARGASAASAWGRIVGAS